MPCYHPLLGYRSRTLSKNGKRPIVFTPNEGYSDLPVQIPCGQCIGCRLERSRQWAIRCVHEAQLYNRDNNNEEERTTYGNSFVTLTFADGSLDSSHSVAVRDIQLFMKRLRKALDHPVRYFACGEYGDELSRPHYHLILFNQDFFEDRQFWCKNGDNSLYISPTLQDCWNFGYSLIGEFSFESAAYVARYILKKQTGVAGDEFYGDRSPPFVTMSRRPGIGYEWFKRFESDVYPSDFVVVRNGIKCRPPKFYDSKYFDIDNVKASRINAVHEFIHSEEGSLRRGYVKEKIKLIIGKSVRRSYECN